MTDHWQHFLESWWQFLERHPEFGRDSVSRPLMKIHETRRMIEPPVLYVKRGIQQVFPAVDERCKRVR